MRVLKLITVALPVLVSAALLTPAATAQTRYTLLVTMDSTADREWFQDAGDQGYWWEDWHEATTYWARSTRAFAITRRGDGRTFAFSAKVAGTLGHLGSGVQGWWGYPGPQTCRRTWRQWSEGAVPVQGTVSLAGRRASEQIRAWVAMPAAPEPIQSAIDTVCQPAEYSFSVRGPGSIDTPLAGYVKTDQLRRRYGRAFTITSDWTAPSVTVFGRMRNRLRLQFTPVAQAAKEPEQQPERQRWQVDVRGTDTWRWGVLTGLRAGVDVDWQHRTTLVLEDGRIISAVGKVSILNVRRYSEPLRVFTVTSTRKTWPEYHLPGATKRKDSARVTLLMFDKSGRSEYRVNYAARVAGPEALDIIRKAGLPDPEIRYQSLVDRGTVQIAAQTFVPDPGRLVFLLKPGDQWRPTSTFDDQVPCPTAPTSEECRLSRGAQRVRVTRLP